MHFLQQSRSQNMSKCLFLYQNLFPEDMVTTGGNDATEIAGIMTGNIGFVQFPASLSSS